MEDVNWGAAVQGTWPGFGVVDPVLNSGSLGPQPAVHTVLLGKEALDRSTADPWSTGDSTTAFPSYYAEVILRGGATSTRFVCDWGGQFSAVFQAIEINRISYNPYIVDDEQVAQPDGRFKYAAMVGYGGWAAGGKLTYTGKQRLLTEMGSPGNRVEISVPPHARRFYPRLLQYTASNWDFTGTVASEAYVPAWIEQCRIFIDNLCVCKLSEKIINDGIEIAGCNTITLNAFLAGDPTWPSGVQNLHLVSPHFELCL